MCMYILYIYIDDSCKHLAPAFVLLQQSAICTRNDRETEKRLSIIFKNNACPNEFRCTKTMRCVTKNDMRSCIYFTLKNIKICLIMNISTFTL